MDELEVAQELADIADEISMRYFTRDPEVTTKADGTLVTEADKSIEQALRKRIREAFPSHAILGEETGLEGEASAPTWVIDPIDGTNNFAWGIPIFATLIALRIDDRSKVGVASAPALSERYAAVRGSGATLNGQPIHVSDVSSLEEARIGFGSERGMLNDLIGQDKWMSLIRRVRRSRGFGDFWGHLLVARGSHEVMVEPALAIWDIAALEVIVGEAGGRVSGWSGRPYPDQPNARVGDYSTALTTNGKLHEAMVDFLIGDGH